MVLITSCFVFPISVLPRVLTESIMKYFLPVAAVFRAKRSLLSPVAIEFAAAADVLAVKLMLVTVAPVTDAPYDSSMNLQWPPSVIREAAVPDPVSRLKRVNGTLVVVVTIMMMSEATVEAIVAYYIYIHTYIIYQSTFMYNH